MKIYYNQNLKEFARQLRNNPTPAEKLLWQHLKGNKLMGYDFHRQKPIEKYIADFYCYKLRLVIELDGEIHDSTEAIANDQNRDYVMKELGLTVLRFRNEVVINDLDSVIRVLKNYIVDFERRLTNK